MKRILQLTVVTVITALGILFAREGATIGDGKVRYPSRHYFHVNDVEHFATIVRDAVVESPAWTGTTKPPLEFSQVEQIARKELRKLVGDEPQWEVFQFELHRLRSSSPPKWYYAVCFEPVEERKTITTNLHHNAVTVLVDFSGRAGKLDEPKERD